MHNRVSLFVYASVGIRREDKGERAYVRGAKVYAACLDELELVLDVRGEGEGFVCKCAMFCSVREEVRDEVVKLRVCRRPGRSSRCQS